MKKLIVGILSLISSLAFAADGTYILTYPTSIEFYQDNDLDTRAGAQRIMQLQRSAITMDQALTFSGDLTISGGVSSMTFSDSASSIVLPDNDTTALDIGSAGRLNLLRFDTGNNTETVIVTGTTATTALHVDVGESLFDEGVDMAVPAAALQVIRFCGNGHNAGTASFMGPVLLDDTEADLAFGGAGCDALDNTTEATADAPWHSSFAFKPVAMVCVGRCTGASAASDAVTYQLRDDTANVAGMACTAAAWTGDDNVQQCVVRDASPATVAANSAIAVQISGTADACTDAGDDFECLLYVTF